MRIELNGEERQLTENTTLAELITSLRLGTAAVAVERNFELVPRDKYDTTALAEGDQLEIVTFVGGG